MKINGLFERDYRKVSDLEYGEAFIYDNILYIKAAIYDEELSNLAGEVSFRDVAVGLPGGYVDETFINENPIVEWVDIEINVTGVLN